MSYRDHNFNPDGTPIRRGQQTAPQSAPPYRGAATSRGSHNTYNPASGMRAPASNPPLNLSNEHFGQPFQTPTRAAYQPGRSFEAYHDSTTGHQNNPTNVQNQPSAQSHVSSGLVITSFNQAQQRQQALLWRPPLNDGTVPNFGDTRVICGYVRSLSEAMKSIENCHDIGSTAWKHWYQKLYSDEDVETIAWLIMGQMRNLHTRGSTSWFFRTFKDNPDCPVFEERDENNNDLKDRDRQLNFERRFNVILDLLTQNKSLCDMVIRQTFLEHLVTAPFRLAQDNGAKIRPQMSAIYVQPRHSTTPAAPPTALRGSAHSQAPRRGASHDTQRPPHHHGGGPGGSGNFDPMGFSRNQPEDPFI